ncbi:hypothetical protein WJX84_005075 [Apatococcus fuscideae]|uniref:Anaphase-promoting complex subunit 4-like WD40 domain-containing protein n=1 Tax=Apatococcus fuscideae TaxID=2026836 RepID=A0AAW1SSE6_9CHLO
MRIKRRPKGGSHLAAAGVGKKICIYPISSSQEQPSTIIPSSSNHHPSKLSSLNWSPNHADVVALGDYDGVVTQLHLPTGHSIWQADDHDGARIWSVQYSEQDPSLLVSACEDGTARLWSHHSEHCLNIIAPRSQAALCSAVFSPVNSHVMALASADHNAYVYDLRATQEPLYTLRGHQDSVSYVRFLSATIPAVSESKYGMQHAA